MVTDVGVGVDNEGNVERMTRNEIKVAAVQLISGPDAVANVDAAIALIVRAADEGATYIQLPEYFNYVGSSKNFNSISEQIPGPTTRRLGEIARTRRVTIHLGSMLEVSPVAGKFYNTSVVLNGAGMVAATYRKVHLFDVDVPGEVVHRESDLTVPGQQLVLAQLPEFQLGMSICFDLRFPEMYRQLAARGATVFAIPSAFAVATGKAHWDVLVKARAIENHAYVVAAAQVGTTVEGVSTYGHSMIVGPWGEVLAESFTDGEDVLVAAIDINEVVRRRSQIAVLDMRRLDLYGDVHSLDGVRENTETPT